MKRRSREAVCQRCSKPFVGSRAGVRFCSTNCRRYAWWKKNCSTEHDETCANCGDTFKAHRMNHSFCSDGCRMDTKLADRLVEHEYVQCAWPGCEQQFQRCSVRQRYCSDLHRQMAAWKRQNERAVASHHREGVCEECGAAFQTGYAKKRFCGGRCQGRASMRTWRAKKKQQVAA